MKILYLGEISPGQTCLMRMRCLERLGHQVIGINTVQPWREASWLKRQAQRRLGCGSVVDQINKSVSDTAQQFKPDVVWADKQEFLRGETIEGLKKLGARTIHFTPDPYFYLAWKRTSLMDQAIQAFDVLVYCKSYESDQYKSLQKPTVYMPLGYCDQTHRPLPSDDAKWDCQFGFLGGWEPRRERLLTELAKNTSGLKIWGGYWNHLSDGRWTFRRRIILGQLAGGDRFRISQNQVLANCLQGGEVYGDEYAKALTGAKIGLGLLRRVCPDQHTTRTFEIPACGSMLLADRTQEHQEFFEEGKEADFFSDDDELVSKAAFYQKNGDVSSRIAQRGYQRCIEGRYAYIHRMENALSTAMKS